MERLRQQQDLLSAVPTRLGLTLEAAPTPPPHLACRLSPRSNPSLAKPRRQPRPLDQHYSAVSRLSALLRPADPRGALPLPTFQTSEAASPPESRYALNPPSTAPREKHQYAWDARSAAAIPRQPLGASTRRFLNTSFLESALSSLRLTDTHQTPASHLSKSPKASIDAIHPQQVGGGALRRLALQPVASHAAEQHAVDQEYATCDQPTRSRLPGTNNICAYGNDDYSADVPGTDDDGGGGGGGDDAYRLPAYNGEGNGYGHNGGEEGQDGDGDGDGRDGDGTECSNPNRRRAQPAPGRPLSCPYRKRNKRRFNIRDYPQCTKEFRDLSSLKSVHPFQRHSDTARFG